MKTFIQTKMCRPIFLLALLGFLADVGHAAGPGFPDGGGAPTNTPLDSWSFYDHTNWTSDNGYFPVSFTNIISSQLGDFNSLVVDTNIPAWLQYNVYENDGTTNLTVDSGTVTFWFAPNWSGTNQGGGGLGEYGRLFEVGNYTTNSSYGWWSIYVDDGGNNIYFSAQTNDFSSTITPYLSAPISWTTNVFHFVALTYSPTNTTLYLDGAFVTNGAPLTVYPSASVLTNGFFVGSDSNGIYQAHGLFNTVATYNYPLNSNDVATIYDYEAGIYRMNPFNMAMSAIFSAGSTPSDTPTVYEAITGIGNLQYVGTTSTCSYSTNIWITNLVVTAAANGTMNMTFAIEGGADGVPYDVFVNSVLAFGPTGMPWAWEGQGYHCNIYTITNLPNTTCFLILGTPQDSDGDGLTDAYENLVSKSDPHIYNTSGDGLSDGWDVLLGLSPLVNQLAQPSTRSNYSYDSADWLEGISGVRTGSVSLDNEGNVLSVSQ
jgi:hypothetical protein